MSKFPMIKKAFPNLQIWAKPYKDDQLVVTAEELESLLQSAQVVYGILDVSGAITIGSTREADSDTHTGLLIAITPIKKKTKAEAALELLGKITNDGFNLPNNADIIIQAKRILEMKDDE